MAASGRHLEVSVPGKAILMGEHAAVYGHPALVAAIDRRLTVTLEASEKPGVTLHLPQLDVCEQASYDQLVLQAEQTRQAWEHYAEDPSRRDFETVQGDDPAHLIRVAVGETLSRLEAKEPPTSGLRLTVDSQIPVGAGFGSSAAAAVAVVAALMTWWGSDADKSQIDSSQVDNTEIEAIALDIERRQHGMPSGIDTATVLHGGLVWAWRDSGRLMSEPMGAEPSILRRIQVFNTGRPAQTTGEVVAAVRRLQVTQTETFDRAMQDIVKTTGGLRRRLTAGSLTDEDLVRDFRVCQRGLEALGVVPEAVCERVRRIEAMGGAAKISGAGSLDGPGAGSLLVFHPQPAALLASDVLDGLEAMHLTLGGPGLERRFGYDRNEPSS